MTLSFILVLIFLLQDFLQVLVMGIFLVPDIFLLGAVLFALLLGNDKDFRIVLIWIAFIGGLIWDLRWTNLPGLTASFNGAAVSAIICFWQKTPVQGRTTATFAFYIFAAQILSGLIHYVSWNVFTQVALRQFMVQQILSVPVLVILCFIFWRVSERNV